MPYFAHFRYISGTRNGESSVPINLTRLALVQIGRIDEQTSFAARATNIGAEEEALKGAAMAQRRARMAFTESLKRDKVSTDSALAHFGTAECLVEEAIHKEKLMARDGKNRKAEIEKLHRQASRRYGAAFLRNPAVNKLYDKLLPLHLDSEATNTLPVVHARYLKVNTGALAVMHAENEEADLHAQSGGVVGQDRWDDAKVPQRPPPVASAGRWDRDGERADAELAAFKRAHNRRLAAAYTPDEIAKARALINRGLMQGRVLKAKRP